MASKLSDTYIGSAELKKLIIKRSTDLEIPFRYICAEIHVNYQEFMQSYINSSESVFEISDRKFEAMLSMLGIDVRFQFVVNTSYDAKTERERLKLKYRDVKS